MRSDTVLQNVDFFSSTPQTSEKHNSGTPLETFYGRKRWVGGGVHPQLLKPPPLLEICWEEAGGSERDSTDIDEELCNLCTTHYFERLPILETGHASTGVKAAKKTSLKRSRHSTVCSGDCAVETPSPFA